MRLVTFNLMHGRSLQDGRVDPARLTAAVAGLDADVLGMQEVDRDQPRSGGADLAALAAAALGDRAAHRFVPTVIGTPGERFRTVTASDAGVGEPHYGVALATRWPVREWRVARLPAARMRAPVYVPGPSGGGMILLDDEPRVLLAAVVDGPWGAMTVATTHLSFIPGWNVRQLRQAIRVLRTLPAPRLLLGDLNIPGRVAGVVSGWRMLAHRPTYPSPTPRVQFDHVLLDPRGAAGLPPPREARTPPVTVSDHRPLVVEW
ncbi:endonuclease/exonuclease/phosphatase family protein [Planosporangium sp. 12N6]|uniref:endonuclease/exonuclease/phosphatase family protein n=1 Tax=Planosporangium spinosum TaxID=3402278 RepID=UPI003CFA3EFA